MHSCNTHAYAVALPDKANQSALIEVILQCLLGPLDSSGLI